MSCRLQFLALEIKSPDCLRQIVEYEIARIRKLLSSSVRYQSGDDLEKYVYDLEQVVNQMDERGTLTAGDGEGERKLAELTTLRRLVGLTRLLKRFEQGEIPFKSEGGNDACSLLDLTLEANDPFQAVLDARRLQSARAKGRMRSGRPA